MHWTWWVGLGVATAILSFLYTEPLRAQHHHPDRSYSGAVGAFYERWKMPDNRLASCCSDQDCQPAKMEQRDGAWYAHVRRVRDGKEWMEWVRIPDEKLDWDETSPDANNHACVNPYSGTVYCAIITSGG